MLMALTGAIAELLSHLQPGKPHSVALKGKVKQRELVTQQTVFFLDYHLAFVCSHALLKIHLVPNALFSCGLVSLVVNLVFFCLEQRSS